MCQTLAPNCNDRTVKLAEKFGKTICKLPEMQKQEFKSDHLEHFLRCFAVGFGLKAALHEVWPGVDDDLGSADADEASVESYFTAWHQWSQLVAGMSPSDELNKYMQDIIKAVQAYVEPRKENMQQLGMKLAKGKLAHIANLKVKLWKVAGGTDTGAVWKASLPDDIELHDPLFIKASKIVENGFFQAIETRTATLKQVSAIPRTLISLVSTAWSPLGGNLAKVGGL